MKKLILIIMTIFLLAGCNQLSLMFYDYNWQIPEEFETTREVMAFVAEFNYKGDTTNDCLLPHEFYYRGYGDCEDFALMLQFLFEVELGYSADLIIGYHDGSSTYHAWVESDGAIYETTNGTIGNKSLYEPVYRYPYPDTVWMVETFGGYLDSKDYYY